ncbi:YlcI/YnfO family protein [Simplicispira sp.]|uniref:YlcI/YnfO family protein n=1 Tax=Simplicispira sp. TaxID=2015802 RepID=UPI002583CBB3|nr:YlcI/YnfO family protein [Simplicispira sp.]
MNQPKVQHTRITLRIPQPIQDKAKAKSQTEHISLNSFIVRAVERAIAQKGQQQ